MAPIEGWQGPQPAAWLSERDLKAQAARLIAALDSSVDWDRRAEALVALEALVPGRGREHSRLPGGPEAAAGAPAVPAHRPVGHPR